MVPNLFKVVRFKQRSVCNELQNHNWIRNLKEVSSATELEGFIMLYWALSLVSLNDQADKIR
jgi:hypothetical protein